MFELKVWQSGVELAKNVCLIFSRMLAYLLLPASADWETTGLCQPTTL